MTRSNSKPQESDTETNAVTDLLMKLDTKMDKMRSDITVNLEKQTKIVRNEFQKHLSEFDNKLVNVINSQDERLCDLEAIKENDDRVARLNDIIIKGMPVVQNEKISAAIKFNQSIFTSINNIFRLKPLHQNQPAPILIQFSTQLLKRDFMSKYFSHGQLKLKDIGLSSENRIYASDNLTKLIAFYRKL